MQKTNYNAQLHSVERRGQTVLLHVCCAPCSCGVLPRLHGFTVLPFFYNPNIDTREEYDLRAAQFAALGVRPHICTYAHEEFLQAVAGLEQEREGGKRCRACIALRLQRTAQEAARQNADFFCSTLSVSPHKDADFINETGNLLAKKYGIPFLPNDFKKENGFLLSTQESKRLSLYRQNYCGCEFGRV